MSFFSPPPAAFKAQALNRVEGFHPDDSSTPSSSTTNNGAFGDLFSTTTTSGGGTTTMNAHQHQQQHHGFDLPDPFRKFPSSVNVAAANVEFNDELSMATLLGGPGDRSSPNGHHHHHQGHHQTHQQQHQQQQQYEDPTAYENPPTAYRIFDVSASSASSTASSAFPTHFSSSSTTTNNGGGGAGSQPSSLHEAYQQHPFNSTLPAINSTMRYDPPSPSSPQLPPSSTTNPPPSSFHPAHAHLTRHTPSPASRSRSRSRPPSSSSAPPPAANGAGGVGPARTTRARRNNSISGTSPPPFGVHHAHVRPHSIVIPGSRMSSLSGMAHAGSPLSTSSNGGGGGGNGWFVPGQSQSSASEYSLPTPDTHTHPPHPHHQQYTPFVLSSSQDMHHHLPPLHHSHPHSHHAHSHSLPKGLDTQAVNLMALPPYDPLPPQNQAQQVQLPPPSHVSPPSAAHAGGQGGGGQQVQQQGQQVVVGDKQALLANEKRRRRRESHNAVERRRRDNINEKISELATLIPECMLDVAGPNGNGNGNASSPSAASPGGGIMSNGLPDPDTLLTPGGTPIDAVNGVLNGLNPSANGLNCATVNGLNGTPVRKDSSDDGGPGGGQQGDGGVVKANKGMILRKSVEYIRYLQQLVTAQGARNRELEQELKAYRRRSRSSSSMEPPLTDSGTGDGMILHDELHFHHGHLGRLPSMPEEGGDGDDLMMGLEEDGLGIGMGIGMKGSLSPVSTEGEREGEVDRLEERGRTRGVRGLKAEVQSDDSLLGM